MLELVVSLFFLLLLVFFNFEMKLGRSDVVYINNKFIGRVKFEQSSASPIGEYCWPSVGKIYTAMIFSV